MSADFYLQFLDKNNKGKRVTTLNEAIKLPNVSTGIPDVIKGVEQSTATRPTKERKHLGLPIVDIASLKETIFEYSNGYNTNLNQPICVLGDPGMGKSAIILDTAKKVCSSIYGGKREFVELAKVISDTDKFNEVYNNPSGFYVFMDVRMTAYEKYELKGTPFPSKTQEGTMESLFETWMAILFLKDAAGMLFLDELNQTSIETQTALYGILHKDERTIGGRAIANKRGWSVHAAGNLPETGSGVQTMLAALQDRMNTVWLEVNYPTWVGWAETAKSATDQGEERPMFHPLVLGFLGQTHEALDEEQFKNIFIQTTDTKKGALNAPNPRNFVALSESLYSLDDVIKMKASKLSEEVAALQDSYTGLKEGTPAKTRAYTEIESKKAQYTHLTQNYASECEQRAKMKINTPWAIKFRRYVAAQNVNINDIFEYEKEEPAKESITKKLTYKQAKGGGVETGSTPQEVTNNMGQLKELIQSLVVQFVKDCGLNDYLEGNKTIPHALATGKEKYDKFVAGLPTGVNKDIQNDFKYIARIYTIINTQVKEGAKDLAAITWNYLSSLEHNGVPVFPLFQIALDRNCTPEQLSKLKDDRGKDIAFSRAEMAAAMKGLTAKLKEDIQGYSTAKAAPEEEEEGATQSASLNTINNLLKKSINFLKKA